MEEDEPRRKAICQREIAEARQEQIPGESARQEEAGYDDTCTYQLAERNQERHCDEACAWISSVSHTDLLFGCGEHCTGPAADECHDVLTERGGTVPQLLLIGKMFELWGGCDGREQGTCPGLPRTCIPTRNPARAAIPCFKNSSSHWTSMCHDSAIRKKQERDRHQIRDDVTKRGGAGDSSFPLGLRRDGRLRNRFRDNKRALGNHFERVQRWVIGNRPQSRQAAQAGGYGGHLKSQDDPAGPRSQDKNAAPLMTLSPMPGSPSSGSIAPFPPYDDPFERSESPGMGSNSHKSCQRQPGQRGWASDGVNDSDPGGPSQPAAICTDSKSPESIGTSSVSRASGYSCFNPVLGEVHFPRMKPDGGLFNNSNDIASCSRSPVVSSIDSEARRCIGLWMRDLWKLSSTDFRPNDVNPSRPRSFDVSYCDSFQGRIWMGKPEEEQMYEDKRVGESAGLSFISRYKFSGYHTPNSVKPAFHANRPVDVQGIRTRSFDSWFDNVTNRTMGPWFTPRLPISAETNDTSSSDEPSVENEFCGSCQSLSSKEHAVPGESILIEIGEGAAQRAKGLQEAIEGSLNEAHAAVPRSNSISQSTQWEFQSGFEDIYNAAPRHPPERDSAPDQTDQPAISSVSDEINDFDNQVLDSMEQLFRPSIDQILNLPRTAGYHLPSWESPRRPSTLNGSDHQSNYTATSSRIPSIGVQITPATTVGDVPHMEDSPVTEGDVRTENG